MNVKDLPPRYQKQVQDKLGDTAQTAKNKGKKSKYRNTKTKVGNITFDSKKEAERFEELMVMYNAGLITDLKLQHNFTLRESYVTPDGERIKGTIYKADFTYYDTDGKFYIEDVKGVPTEVYKLKRKMMIDRGFKVTEI